MIDLSPELGIWDRLPMAVSWWDQSCHPVCMYSSPIRQVTISVLCGESYGTIKSCITKAYLLVRCFSTGLG